MSEKVLNAILALAVVLAAAWAQYVGFALSDSWGFDSMSGAGRALLVLAGVLGFALYFVPMGIAESRRVPNFVSVAVVNVLLGWTFFGWVAALAMAVVGKPEESRIPPTKISS